MTPEEAPTTPKRGLTPIVGIFLTVFLDLLGFGLFIPDLQLRGQEIAMKTLGVTRNDDPRVNFLIGAILGVFSLAQLLTAPYLGRLSDRIGRRKVLLITCALATISYVLYAHAETLPWIVMSRIFMGIAGANLGVAFAYIADVTTPENRAKGLGLVGAAFGLGFILGPVIGALLLKAGNNHPLLLGYVGAALAAINLAYVYFLLPESLPTGERNERGFVANLQVALRTPVLGLLLVMFFMVNFGFTNLETTFFRLLADPRSVFHLGDTARQTGAYILGIVGVIGAFMQGFMVRKLTPIYGEVKLLRFGYLLMVPALALVPFCPLWVPALCVIAALGIGSGLAQPSLSSLISRSSPANMQGSVFGITQGLGAFARFIAPVISNQLFGFRPYAPYLFGAALAVLPMFAAWSLRQPDPATEPDVIPAH